MEIYLLKSAACMGIFLLFYKLLLEKESMHQFKRFFLLTAVIASFIIPQIVFTEYVEIEPSTAVTQIITIIEPQEIQPVVQTIANSPMNWSLILWTIYGLGVAGFALRFLINLHKIWKRIHNNPRTKHSAIYRILLKEQLPPHTFLRYIFLNKRKFEVNSIPNSVIKHEETHAKEWHSLDVLFIEILQVLFWFNPVIYAFKKSIKLNHEFLADSAVLNGQEDHLNYQNTILSYLSNDSFNTHQSVGIANAINYSSIKKRFIIMKKQTSKKGILIRSLLLLPLLAILLFGFSEKSTKYSNANRTSNNQLDTKRIIKLAGSVVDSKTLQPLENAEIRDKKGNLLTATDNHGNYSLKLEIEQPGEIYFSLSVKKNGYKSLIQQEHWGNLQGEITSTFNFGLQNKNSDVPEFSKIFKSNSDSSNSSIQEFKVNAIQEHAFNQKLKNAKKGNEKIVIEIDNIHYLVSSSGWIQLNNLNDFISVNDNKIIPATQLNAIVKRHSVKAMSPLEDYDNAQFAIYTSSGDINKNLNKRSFNNYNTLAKKYNAIPIEKRSIPLSDLRMLESIYKNMTVEERKSAQPFPECLPKQNQDGATKEQLSTYNKLAKSYNTMISEGGNIRILKADVDQLTYIYGLMSEKQKVNAEPFPDLPEPPPAPKAPNTSEYADSQINEIIENQDPYDHLNLDAKAINGIPSNTQTFHSKPSSPVAPPPPTPPSPLDYAISMAKKGATFFYEGKEVSSDKAIDLLKKNKALNIESRKKNSKAEVRITKEPVTIR
ncbi:M56 family metallopeptidase [Maribacter litoralis]|uniref:M56 family metallopeptidase n=1 Tax=Maribacter litoralis TaxID=2059726 RepID=UPI003F5CEC97